MNPTDGLSGICFVRVIGVMAGEWDQDGAVIDQACEFFGEVYPRIGRWHWVSSEVGWSINDRFVFVIVIKECDYSIMKYFKKYRLKERYQKDKAKFMQLLI